MIRDGASNAGARIYGEQAKKFQHLIFYKSNIVKIALSLLSYIY